METNIEIIKRKIKEAGGSERGSLSDVLLVISSKFICDSSFKGGISRDGGWYENGKLLASWNLLDDDLRNQSPETIDFLYSLLKA